MRVVWLMPNLHITGGARVCVELANRMVDRGHTFYIAIPSGRFKLKWKCHAQVIECGPRLNSPLLTIPPAMLAMSVRLPDADVLVASMPPYALLAHYLGSARGIPAVNYVMNDDVHFFDDRTHIDSELLLKLYRAVARASIRHAPILVNSHWTAVRCVVEGGAKPRAFVPHGYDPLMFRLATPPRFPGGIKGGLMRLITIGRKERWKGYTDLIEALNLLDPDCTPFELLVLSQDDLDTTQARFPIQLIKPSGDASLAELYRSGDVFLHTSRFEGFGIPLLEAMACGLAVVSTDSGGVREFLRDGHNALMVSPREPQSLADAVQKVLDDSDLRHSLAQNGVATCAGFIWDRAADKFEAALKEIGAKL